MQFIPLTKLTISNRQRQFIKPADLQELADSISKVGLLHPPVLAIEGKVIRLVAGERRCAAMRKLHDDGILFECSGELVPPGHIPYTTLSSREAADQFEAEFDENVRRVDLTWQEQARAYQTLHKLRKSVNPKQTLTDTTKEIVARTKGSENRERMRLSRSTIVEPYMDDPQVQKARNLDEAYRIVLDKIEKQATAQLTADSPRPNVTVKHRVICGDLTEVLPTLPTGDFDLIICDPPYGIDAHKQFPLKTAVKHLYDDTKDNAFELSSFIIEQGVRLLKPRSNLFMFCDLDLFTPLRDLAASLEYSVWRIPLIWKKDNSGYAPWGRLGFHRTYETILWITRGQRGARQTAPDIIDIPKVRDKSHAAEKPVDLYHHLINLTCLPNDNILDPCCGSGPVFPAAERHRCVATGVELDETHYNTCVGRINNIGIDQLDPLDQMLERRSK